MAKRVRIYGPGLDTKGITIGLPDDSSPKTVAAFLDEGVHELKWKSSTFHWVGGAGCPFIFVFEEFSSQAPRAVSF